VTRAIASVIPEGAHLLAELQVPSRAIGFVSPSSRVTIRYAAFPFSKYGLQYGKIRSISQSTKPKSTIATPSDNSTKIDSGEDYYKVLVDLDEQSIATANGQGLKAGMALDADILLDNYTIIEWLAGPLIDSYKNFNVDSGN
jgi:membrane fusion protein